VVLADGRHGALWLAVSLVARHTETIAAAEGAPLEAVQALQSRVATMQDSHALVVQALSCNVAGALSQQVLLDTGNYHLLHYASEVGRRPWRPTMRSLHRIIQFSPQEALTICGGCIAIARASNTAEVQQRQFKAILAHGSAMNTVALGCGDTLFDTLAAVSTCQPGRIGLLEAICGVVLLCEASLARRVQLLLELAECALPLVKGPSTPQQPPSPPQSSPPRGSPGDPGGDFSPASRRAALDAQQLEMLLGRVFLLCYSEPPAAPQVEAFLTGAFIHAAGSPRPQPPQDSIGGRPQRIDCWQLTGALVGWSAVLEAMKPLRRTYLHVVFLEPTPGEWHAVGYNKPTVFNILVRKGGRDHCIVAKRYSELLELYGQLNQAAASELAHSQGITRTLRSTIGWLDPSQTLLHAKPGAPAILGEAALLPPFPDKHVSLTTWENYSTRFVEERKVALQCFFNALLDREDWHEHPVLLDFFQVRAPSQKPSSMAAQMASFPSPAQGASDSEEEDDAAYEDTMNWVAQVEEASLGGGHHDEPRRLSAVLEDYL